MVIAVRTPMIGTVAVVRCKRERKNVVDVRSFVFTAIHTYMHAHVFLCYQHRYFIHMLQKKKEKKTTREEGKEGEWEERKEGYRGKEGGRSFVPVVVFVRSVSCPVLYCVLLCWVPRPPGAASSLLSPSRIIIISSSKL